MALALGFLPLTTTALEPQAANVTLTLGVNNTANQVCPTADWRRLSFFGAVSLADFTPENVSLADSSGYYRAHVIPRALPSAVLLALSLALLLCYLLWRVFRCISRTCCCCCRGASKHPLKIVSGGCWAAHQAVIVVLVLGVLGACSYGMSKVNPLLVQQAQGTVDSFKAYGVSAFAQAGGVVAQVAGFGGLLDRVTYILASDVNATALAADFGCIRPWLTGLVDPALIQQELASLQYELTSVLTPALALLSASLVTLNTQTIPTLQAASATLGGTNAFMSAYTTQSQNYVNAVGNFPAYNSASPDYPALASALAALLPLTGNPSKVATLQGIEDAFTAFYTVKTSGIFGSLISGINGVLGASNNITLALPVLSVQVGGVGSGYQGARPCISDLLARAADINTTVLVLPPAISGPIAQLSAAEAALDALVLGSNLTAVAALLNASTAAVAVPQPLTNNTLTTVTNAQSGLANYPDPNGATGINTLYFENVKSATNNANGPVTTCNTAYGTYKGKVNAGTQTSSDYSTLQSQCSPSQAPMNALLALLNGYGASGAPTAINSLTGVSAAITSAPSTAPLASALTSAAAAVAAVPNLVTLGATLNAPAAAYAALPADKGGYLDATQAQISAITTSVSTGVVSAKAQIASGVASLNAQIGTAQNSTTVRLQAYEDQYGGQVAQYDRIRLIVEFVVLGAMMLVAILAAVGALTACEFLAGLATLLLLLLTALFALLGLLTFTAASVGNDGCQNFEPKLLSLIPTLLGPGNTSADATAWLAYYFYDEGGPPLVLLNATLGVDLNALFASINATRDSALQGLVGNYTLQPKLASVVSDAVTLTGAIEGAVLGVVGLLDYANIHPLYLQAKATACCTVVDMLGGLWLAFFITVSLNLALIVALLALLGKLDRLPRKWCCGCGPRSKREFQPLRSVVPAPPSFGTAKKGGLLPSDSQDLRSESSTAGLIPAAYSSSATEGHTHGRSGAGSFSGAAGPSKLGGAPKPYGPPASAKAHLVPPRAAPGGIQPQGSGQPLLQEEPAPLKRTGLLAGSPQAKKKKSRKSDVEESGKSASSQSSPYQEHIRHALRMHGPPM